MKAIETFKHAGYNVQIIPDQDAQPPDEFGDDNVFLVTTNNRYFVKTKEGFELDSIRDGEYDDKYHALPVFSYIHGGVALSLGRGGQFSDPWDSGQIGYLLLAKSEWSDETSARKFAEGYIESWNQYLSGDVYGYDITDDEGNDVDSTWGFYGLDYAIGEAKSAAEYARKHEESEAAKITAMMHS